MAPIDEAVSSADANRRFSEILRKVRDGRSVTVTSHGKPVARIVPISPHDTLDGRFVFRMTDGEPLGKRQIPSEMSRMTTLGRNILVWGESVRETLRALSSYMPHALP